MSTAYTFATPPKANPATRRLLPHVLDEGATTHPDSLWAEFPASPTSYDAGFRPITWRALANAVNGLAAALVAGKGTGRNFETLAYMGPMDPRHPMMALACIKTGHKIFLSSPRNSMAAHTSLFEKLQCRTIATTAPPPPYVAPLLQAFPDITLLSVPSLDELLSTEYPQFPYDKTYEEAKDDPIFCLHTSGSTGLPKPIVYNHQFVTRAVNISHLQPPDGYDLLNRRISGIRGILFLPLFHIAGLYFSTFSTLINDDIMVYPIGNAPPTAASLRSILEKTPAEWAFIAPMHVEEIVRDPSLLDFIASKLKTIIVSGGSLSPSVGNVLSDRVHLRTMIGSSELAGLPHLIPKGSTSSGDDWTYIHIHPSINPDFQDHGDGDFELTFKRDPLYEQWQPEFVLFPELKSFTTRDLFTPHPTRPNLWIHKGREDDIIVFSSGEKTNPLTFEATVAANPDVSSALVFGDQHFEAGILIESLSEKQADTTPKGIAKLLAKVFPSIEAANSVTPAYARIDRSHVIFADPGKPFLRSDKGTVQRQMTLKLYEPAINNLYSSIESVNSNGAAGQLHANDIVSPGGSKAPTAAIEDAIFSSLQHSTNLVVDDPDQDFFAAGLDSLQALRLARQLGTQLSQPIEPSVVYANPSVRSLTIALGRASAASRLDSSSSLSDPTELIFTKYSNYMEVLASCINKPSRSGHTHGESSHVVLLTGSTGFVGAELLKTLLSISSVSHILCLNRRAVSRHPSSRVTELEAHLSDPNTLGLPQETYANTLSRVTLIIHAAWPVDFVQPLSRFGPSLAETAHLLLLAARAPRKPAMLYLSSVSAVMNLKHSDTLVPSAVVTDTQAPMKGYGESKHVAERLVNQAARQYGVRAGIVRLGQIAGPRNGEGRWNAKEWLPRLVKSSKSLGCVPQSLGRSADVLDWVPVDEAATLLGEIGMHLASNRKPEPAGAEVFNVVNPHPGTWTSALGGIREVLGVDATSGAEWLQRLRTAGDGIDDGAPETADSKLVQLPALPLQEFYRAIFDDHQPLRMDTRGTELVSATMRGLRGVDDGLVKRWVQSMLEV